MWRISIAIRRVVRTTLLRLAARLEELDAAPARPPDEEGIPADWLARVRRGAPQLLRKDAASYAVVRRPIAKSSDNADAPADVPMPRSVAEDATATRSREARSHAEADVIATPARAPRIDDAAPIRPRAPRGEERAPMAPRLVPRIADDAPPGRSPNTTRTHSDTSPDESRARSRHFPAVSIAGVPDVDGPARPSPHSFDSPAESQAVSRLASEGFGSPSAHRHTRASRFPLPQAGEGQRFDGQQAVHTRLPAPHDARDNAPAAPAEPRQAVFAPYHPEYQRQWQTLDHKEWQSRYHDEYHDGYHHDYHRNCRPVIADGESSPQEPRPSWPELPDAPLFGIPLTPIATFDDAGHLARLSDEQRGSAWSE